MRNFPLCETSRRQKNYLFDIPVNHLKSRHKLENFIQLCTRVQVCDVIWISEEKDRLHRITMDLDEMFMMNHDFEDSSMGPTVNYLS